MNMQDKNRRQSARLPVALQASVKDIDNTLSVAVLNVSQGGLFIKCAKPPKRWSNITIEIDLQDGGQPINANGVVVWVVEEKKAKPQEGVYAGAGVQFTDLAPADLKRLQQHVIKTP